MAAMCGMQREVNPCKDNLNSVVSGIDALQTTYPNCTLWSAWPTIASSAAPAQHTGLALLLKMRSLCKGSTGQTGSPPWTAAAA